MPSAVITHRYHKVYVTHLSTDSCTGDIILMGPLLYDYNGAFFLIVESVGDNLGEPHIGIASDCLGFHLDGIVRVIDNDPVSTLPSTDTGDRSCEFPARFIVGEFNFGKLLIGN